MKIFTSLININFQSENETISQIKYLADILEQCDFAQFWNRVHQMPELCNRITGFHDSIRKFVCHVVGITFQTIEKNNLADLLGGIDGECFFSFHTYIISHNYSCCGRESNLRHHTQHAESV